MSSSLPEEARVALAPARAARPARRERSLPPLRKGRTLLLAGADAAVLLADGVPVPEEDRVYELWAIRDGTPERFDIFRPDADGTLADALAVAPDAGERLQRLAAWLRELPPPKYPFPIDAERAAAGEAAAIAASRESSMRIFMGCLNSVFFDLSAWRQLREGRRLGSGSRWAV